MTFTMTFATTNKYSYQLAHYRWCKLVVDSTPVTNFFSAIFHSWLLFTNSAVANVLKQYVGSNITDFSYRFNNYKSAFRKVSQSVGGRGGRGG